MAHLKRSTQSLAMYLSLRSTVICSPMASMAIRRLDYEFRMDCTLPAGVDGLYVHTQAVNEVARSFYERQGFIIEQEESSNDAHYRGKCLDGIEGRGRSILLRDTVL